MTRNHSCRVAGGLRATVFVMLALSSSTALLMADGEKIQFSAPGSSTNTVSGLPAGTSEFNRLSRSPSTFKQLQDDLLHPIHKSQGDEDSMQGVFSIPTHSSANHEESSSESSARARHTRDKKKNWAFSNMNDLDGKSDTDDTKDAAAAGSADSSKQSDTSVIESFVFGKKDSVQTNQVNQVQWSDATHDDLRGRALAGDSSGQLGQRSSALSGSLDNNVFSDSSNGTELSSHTGGALDRFNSSVTQMDSDAMQKHRESFKDILDGSAAHADTGNSFRSSSAGGNTGGNGFITQASGFQPSSTASTFGDGGSLGGIKKSSLFDNSSSGGFGGAAFGTPQRSFITPPSSVSSVPNPTQSPFDSLVKRPKL